MRRIFQWFTVVLLVVSVWTAYANVVSDDAEVRAKAKAAVDVAAGCGDACRIEGLRGDRGMLEERIEYDLVKHGHFVVVCRREFIAVGDYTCQVTEGKVVAPSASSAATPASSSSTR